MYWYVINYLSLHEKNIKINPKKPSTEETNGTEIIVPNAVLFIA